MEIEEQLNEETDKWLARIRNERKKIIATDDKGKDLLKNIDAYIEDTEHFRKNNDPVHAFEAVVWAWSWLEICKELGILKNE